MRRSGLDRESFAGIAAIGAWFLLMWMGLNVIDQHDGEMLGYYVFAGSTGIATFIAWVDRIGPKQ